MDEDAAIEMPVKSIVLSKHWIDGDVQVCQTLCHRIFRAVSGYNVCAFLTIAREDQDSWSEENYDVDRGVDIRAAVACVILAEKQALQNGWKTEDVNTARAKDGLVGVARQTDIERRLDGLRSPNLASIVQPQRPRAIMQNYARNGIHIVDPWAHFALP